MTKRMAAALLAAVMILVCVPAAAADSSVCFVGINDSVPMYLSAAEAPYYKGNLLYVPYTVFQAGPGGIAVSYNVDKGSLVLFTRAKRLVYDLNAGTVTDELQKVSNVTVVYRNGVLFIPVAKAASHFGLTAVMLTSSGGSPVLRFTDGGQKLDNTTFIRKAETLISMVLEKEETTFETEVSHQGTEEETEQNNGPATVFLAFVSDAVSRETLQTLETMRVSAAFFVTREQIEQDPGLVRQIYAQGHHIGLTAENAEDYDMALDEANAALDKVLFTKSVTALLPADAPRGERYVTFIYRAANASIEDVLKNTDAPQLFVCRSDVDTVLRRLIAEGAHTPKLRETTYIPAG